MAGLPGPAVAEPVSYDQIEAQCLRSWPVGSNEPQCHAIHANPALSQQRREFAALLDQHLMRGQHPERPQNRWKPWTNNDLAAQVGVSPNTVANWRNTRTPIPPEDILPLLDALFGDKSEYLGYVRELKEVWERARGLVPPATLDLDDPDHWEPVTRTCSALAEIILHQPTPMNRPETYTLNATMRFDTAEQSDGDRTVVIGLREAFVALLTSGYETAQNSLLGEDRKRDCVRVGVGGFTITPEDGCNNLQGSFLGDDYLGVIEPGSGNGKTITAQVCAGSRSFSFAYASTPEQSPILEGQKPNRDAILNLLLGETMRRDSQGRSYSC